MPWRETCQMDERTQFIARVLAGEDAMTVLCHEYGISRKTGYKWLGRYHREGAAGLRDRSHAPLRHGQAHDVAVVQAVLGLRERWPHWGPKKLGSSWASCTLSCRSRWRARSAIGCGAKEWSAGRAGGDVVRPIPSRCRGERGQ